MRITIDINLAFPGLEIPLGWIGNPTGLDANTPGTTYYTKWQFATKEAAANLAGRLGGKLTSISYNAGPYSMSDPMWLIEINGESHNAGLLLKALSQRQDWARTAIKTYIKNLVENPTSFSQLSLPKDPLVQLREDYNL